MGWYLVAPGPGGTEGSPDGGDSSAVLEDLPLHVPQRQVLEQMARVICPAGAFHSLLLSSGLCLWLLIGF